MFQKDSLKSKGIFITGGGTGLGRSMALHFASLGARVFIVGRRPEPLKSVCDEIQRAGGTAAYTSCDVRDYAAVEAARATAIKQIGEINTLVNNAAGNFLARTEKLTPNGFNAVVGIVLNGSFNCTQIFGKNWIENKQPGTVLSIVTTCAKAGVLALTTSLAVEWARHNIRLNAIAPGPFPTEGAWSRLVPSTEMDEHRKQFHPMKRFGRHDELTNLAAFLISDMAPYINGECVVIDGGQWLRGAGEFNDLLDLPVSAWQAMESARPKKS